MRQLVISKQVTLRDDESVNRYFRDINQYELISPEEEVKLVSLVREGDIKALDRLVTSNLRFVVSVAKQYQNKGLPFPDLINEGNIGLVKAAYKFDETRGFKFISYAVWWIRQSIMQAIMEQTRIVRLPLNRVACINKISKAIPYLEQQFEREPANCEIAEYLDLNENAIVENNNNMQRQVSFDMPLSHDGASEISLYDIIETDSTPRPDNELVYESLRIDILRVMKKLDEREFKVISMAYGLNNSKAYSLHEISNRLNISSERVRQIKSSGLVKMKKMLSGKTCFHSNF
jgi:RNA polymerase primary sigma factor